MSTMTHKHRICSAAGITTLLLFSFGACVDFSEPPSGLPTGVVPGADGGTTEPDTTSNPLPNGCGAGEKACNGGCVGLTDPAFGCGAPSCEPCSVGNGAAVCSAGACTVGTCTAPQADCDQKVSTGCETNVQTSAQHCGACGNACAAGQVCSGGACKGSCDQGLIKCGASCAEIKSDVQNCNGCGRVCAAPANGSAVCAASTCGSQCNNGYRSCPGDTCKAESAQACGASCAVCAGPANGNGQAVCTAGACKVQCVAGYSTCVEGCCKDAPVVVPNAYKWGRLACGFSHCCAVTALGGVKCWGANPHGELGNGTIVDSALPVDVQGLSRGVAAVSAGRLHACAVTATGAVKCWGRGSYGRLGNNSVVDSAIPVDVQGAGGGIAIVAAGGTRACVVTIGGSAKCWGGGTTGELGNGGVKDSAVPVDVSGLTSGVTMVAVGELHACALSNAGAVKCWGSGTLGALGNGSSSNSTVPVAVQGLSTGAAMVAAAGAHSCAVTTTGTVKCWGSNSNGQLGNSGAGSAIPVDVQGLNSSISIVAAGGNSTCAVTTGSALKCWGFGENGELGNGQSVSSVIPVDVKGLTSGVAFVVRGYVHACAMTTSGGIKCWGRNSAGQLGNNTTTDSNVPVDVVGF
jgi:alpha-tubulin suppressor-like RCC1 family protein